MSHEVETMMYSGNEPWHGLGKYVGEQPISAEKAIEKAGLDWEVNKTILYYMGEDNYYYPVFDHMAIQRESDGKILGMVSDHYVPLQNREAFSFFDTIVDKGEAIYHTAGSLKGGKIIWLLAKLPNSVEILRGDLVDKYVLLSNAHDGTMAVRITITPIRVVCNNTLSMAHSSVVEDGEEYSNDTRIAHRGEFRKKWKDAQDLLGLINTKYQAVESQWKDWANYEIGQTEAASYIKKVYSQKGKNLESPYNIWAYDMRQKAANNMMSGKGTEIGGVRGSLWGAYNAVIEAQDWGSQLGKTLSGKERRLSSNWFGNSCGIKIRAARLAEEIVARRS